MSNAVKFNVPVPPDVYESLRVTAFHSGKSHSQLVVAAVEQRFSNMANARKPLKKLVPDAGEPKWVRLSVFIPADLLDKAQREVDRQANLKKDPFTGSLTSAIAYLTARKYHRVTLAKTA